MNSDHQLDNQTPQNRSNKKQWVGYLNAWWLEDNMDFVPATRGRISLCSDRPTPYEISQTIYLLLTNFLKYNSSVIHIRVELFAGFGFQLIARSAFPLVSEACFFFFFFGDLAIFAGGI